jgi:hypothetical protein
MANLPVSYELAIYQTTVPYAYAIVLLAAGTPVNLTGYTAVFTCRPWVGDSSIKFQLTSGTGGITLGGSAGTVTINFPVLPPETGAYDLVLYDGSGNEWPVLAGNFAVVEAVTR